MKTLVVAEKPSVGRDIARVLKCAGRGEGCLTGEKYVVTWAIGHLVSLKEPDELDAKYSKWNVYDLPIPPEKIPLKVLKPTASQFKTVKELMNSPEIDHIICATDAGREGELIFRYIYEQAGCKKSFSRLWISSMTDAAIRAGFDSIKPSGEYDALYASARCRSEADWLVGMNATRAFTLRYGSLLSVGRVQTPTLALIVKRDREISAFKPESYWEVRADYGSWQGVWFDPETKNTHIHDEAKAKAIAAKVKGKTAVVTEYRAEEKRVPPEKLYDLTTLQREANRKFGFSAEKTLSVAQALYETHKLITYPRTDSRFLPDDMKPKVSQTLMRLPEPYAAMVRALSPIKTAQRIYDNEKISDHHAIVPTDKVPDLSRLSADESKIYDLVARRLIANHYPDYVYLACSVVTACEGESFKSNASTPVSQGWRALYKADAEDKKKEKDSDGTIPPLKEGDECPILKTSVKSKQTKPPEHYTEDTLLKAMESAGKLIDDEELREKMKDSGLGTPATRAAIIQRLIAVGYIKRERKALLSTEKGQKLISVVPEEMSSAVTTGKWERALNKMAHLSDKAEVAQKREKFMQSIRNYSAFLTDFARTKAANVLFPREEYKKPAANGRKKDTWKAKSTGQ